MVQDDVGDHQREPGNDEGTGLTPSSLALSIPPARHQTVTTIRAYLVYAYRSCLWRMSAQRTEGEVCMLRKLSFVGNSCAVICCCFTFSGATIHSHIDTEKVANIDATHFPQLLFLHGARPVLSQDQESNDNFCEILRLCQHSKSHDTWWKRR